MGGLKLLFPLVLNDGSGVGFEQWFGAWCLSGTGPIVAQLEFFSLDYLQVQYELFSLFHHSVKIWLDCFYMMIH